MIMNERKKNQPFSFFYTISIDDSGRTLMTTDFRLIPHWLGTGTPCISIYTEDIQHYTGCLLKNERSLNSSRTHLHLKNRQKTPVSFFFFKDLTVWRQDTHAVSSSTQPHFQFRWFSKFKTILKLLRFALFNTLYILCIMRIYCHVYDSVWDFDHVLGILN